MILGSELQDQMVGCLKRSWEELDFGKVEKKPLFLREAPVPEGSDVGGGQLIMTTKLAVDAEIYTHRALTGSGGFFNDGLC